MTRLSAARWTTIPVLLAIMGCDGARPVEPAPVPIAEAKLVAQTEPKSGPRALLVGCTTYDSHPDQSLRGPANDVLLMADVLQERFGFDPDNIRKLVEGGAATARPTRVNIVREMETLIQGAQPGQRIVLFFAGHGCQQPDQNPPDPHDPEPDGLDEIFLPADIGLWSSEVQAIRNAIVDDEFRRWTAQLLERDVELLVMFDSCHSGSGLRDIGDERPRRLEPEELIPAEVLSQARGWAADAARGDPTSEPAFDPLAQGKWVAIYAAQPNEVTLETMLPKLSPDARPQGIFTYALCQALREGAAPSYREAIQRIRAHYTAQGYYAPSPLIEGHELDRQVLGAGSVAASISLERDAQGGWFIRAGQIHGLTNGTVLAVRPLQASGDSAPVGHLKIVEAGLARSKVAPCAFGDQAQSNDLPAGGLCRPVFIDYGDLRLRVAIDSAVPADAAGQLLATLRSVEEKADSPVTVVEDADTANWFVTRDTASRQGGWVLSPRSSQQQIRGPSEASLESRSEVAFDDTDSADVEETLRRLNCATNLLALAERLGGDAGANGLKVQLDLLYRAPTAAEATVVPVDRVAHLAAGSKVQFRVTNRGRSAIDFTLLFVDSQFGIEPVFPRSYTMADNRLSGGKSFETHPLTVTADTIGREHLVLIAVPAERFPVNFTFLAQPNLASARTELAQTRGEAQPTSPFESLLQCAAWGGATRGLKQTEMTPVLQTRGWIVQP